MADKRQISVEENGEILAEATISAPDENNDARAEVTVAPGHHPSGTRQRWRTQSTRRCATTTPDISPQRFPRATPSWWTGSEATSATSNCEPPALPASSRALSTGLTATRTHVQLYKPLTVPMGHA